ncbi:FxSxx-COOH system tetratricopeptide repeat protein [Actinoplanes sp. NPDC026619]|uniref:FxSxx-COOH system tetratricopeptide repeat protein n=1 Tax=Actinoplanes sp. NPDC026619 TaxID=3155798 RepID=UPI0033FD8275
MSNGHIVTFYSYKGGTGRTMAVANTAWLLASNGLRVLVVDWDLESPGLHRYLHPFLVDKDLTASPGVIDMVRDYAAAAVEPGHGEGEGWIAERAAVLDYAVSLTWSGFPDGAGIDLLPAGQQDRSYARRVSTFDWASFWERLGGGAFIDALAQNMRRHYDYILIDSRTGLSDSAGICTVQLPDTVVNCFTLSTQSIDGAVSVAQSINAQRDRNPVRILPVPMRVEDAEQLKLDAGRDYARSEFRPFLSAVGDAADRYWGDVEIPYKTFFAYEETLAPFADRPMLENSLLAAYERLAGWITMGQIRKLAPMDDKLRRDWLAQFERRRPSVTSEVLICYAPPDRMWAEWISAELTAVGLRPMLSDAEFAGSSDFEAELDRGLSGARHAMFLLSRDMVNSPQALSVWRQIIRRETGSRKLLTPIRIDGTRLEPPYNGRIATDLTGTSAERARELLAGAVGTTPAPTHGARTGPRFPGTLPPVWNVPQRNTDFTGRGVVLEQLRDRLSASVTAVVPQALFGLGGVGKTQLAIEYAHRFAANYDMVWWISAEQPHLARSSLADLGQELHLERGENLDESVRIVGEALRQGRPHQRWLLIFDNVDQPETIRDIIPQGAGHILLTSRNQAWNQEARAVQLGVFDRAESIALLTRRVRNLDRGDAEQVADRLGDLPLAIEQAASWLNTTAMDVPQYLELLDTQLLRMLDENPPLGYEKTTAATWLLSLERLRERTPAAAKLLEVCAFFAPEPISTKLIYSSRMTQVLLPFDPTLRDPILQGRLIREIGRYALATTNTAQTSIQIHRLVQAVVSNSLDPETRAQDRTDVQLVLASYDRGDPDLQANHPAYATLWPHLRHCGALESDDPAVRQLVVEIARYLYQSGDFSSSQTLAEDALASWQDRFGNDSTTLLMNFTLANVLRLQARYEDAYALDNQAFELLGQLVGPDHPYTVMVAGSLGADLRALGRYQEALMRSEENSRMAVEVFGEDNTRTLMAANNLGVSLRLVGDFNQALDNDEENYTRGRRIDGPAHRNTLSFADNYAHDLRAVGRFREARELLEITLNTSREALGESSVLSLRFARSLATTLRKLGEFVAARALTDDTLRRYRETLGLDHPDALSCLMNRACEESALGHYAEARRTAEQAAAGLRRAYPDNHPFVLAGLNNVAVFTRQSGEVTESRKLTEQVLDSFRSTVGPEHPYTLSAQVNRANELFEAGEYAAALELDEQTWHAMTNVLGANNPDTLAAANNVAISRRVAGDERGASDLRTEVVNRTTEVLGREHPNVVAMRERRRLNCDITPPSI